MKTNPKPQIVRCTQCANAIPPIDNHMMGCKLSRYKVHTGKRVCSNFKRNSAYFI